MNKEEKEAIERFKSKIKRADVDIIKFSDVYTTLDIHNLRLVLNLIQKQSKIIDKMAEYINELDIDEDICTKNVINPQLCNEEYSNCKECIKEYFEKECESDKNV